MKLTRRARKAIVTESLRFAKVEGWESERDITDVFDHITKSYLEMPKKKRGRFILQLETVNKIKQFDYV